jgi:hypothetical protein
MASTRIDTINVVDADGLPYSSYVKADFARWFMVANEAYRGADPDHAAQVVYEALCKLPDRFR